MDGKIEVKAFIERVASVRLDMFAQRHGISKKHATARALEEPAEFAQFCAAIVGAMPPKETPHE